MNIDNKAIGAVLVVVVLLAMTAGASALITRNNLENEDKTVTVTEKTVTSNKPVHHVATTNKVNWNNTRTVQQQPVPVKKACSDGNVVGAVLGAVGGGLVGSQIGGGKGKDVATIGGAAVGGLAGQQYIPTNGVLCSN